MEKVKEGSEGQKYLTEVIPEIHPLAAVCQLLKETGLPIQFRTHPKLTPGYLLVEAPPVLWEKIRSTERLVLKGPEYEALVRAAEGINVSDLGTGEETIAVKLEKLQKLLSSCNDSIIPPDLWNKIIVSAFQKGASLLREAAVLFNKDIPSFRRVPKENLSRRLESMAQEFGGKPVTPKDVEVAVGKLVRKLAKELPKERP